MFSCMFFLFGWAVDAQKMPSPTQIGPKEQKCGLAQTGPGSLDPAKKEMEQPIFPVRFVFCRYRTWHGCSKYTLFLSSLENG